MDGGSPGGAAVARSPAILPPLRGLLLDVDLLFQGLTPQAIDYRHSAAKSGSCRNASQNHKILFRTAHGVCLLRWPMAHTLNRMNTISSPLMTYVFRFLPHKALGLHQIGVVWARKKSDTPDFGVSPRATDSTSSA